jgi:hypothetical protein
MRDKINTGADELAGPANQMGDMPDTSTRISDKQFYKEMQKLKDRGTGAVPPKKSASAYIIYCGKVRKIKYNQARLA